MSNDKTGGPGYPITLLDYFAAKAMRHYLKIVPFEKNYRGTKNPSGSYQWSHADAAEACYDIAEAMLAERKRRGK